MVALSRERLQCNILLGVCGRDSARCYIACDININVGTSVSLTHDICARFGEWKPPLKLCNAVLDGSGLTGIEKIV
jgi:hypothetical protein